MIFDDGTHGLLKPYMKGIFQATNRVVENQLGYREISEERFANGGGSTSMLALSRVFNNFEQYMGWSKRRSSTNNN